MELYRRLSFLGNSPIFLANTLTPIYENAENGALIKMGHGNTSTRNNNNKKYFTKTRQKSQRTCKAQILYTGRHLRPDIFWNSQNSENNREKEKNCIRNIWNESPKNCSDRKKKKLLEAILLLLLSAYQLAAHYTIRAGKKKSRNKFSESVAASIRAVHALWMGFFWCLLSFFFSALPITISPPSRYTIFITLWKPAINFNSHDRTKMPKLPYTRTTTIWTLNNALNKNKKESPFSTYRFDWVSYIFYKIATFFVRLLWCV